jgi:hypothetical protein
MKTIETKITINNCVSVVWENLIDNKNYKTWNPFIINSEGQVAKGAQLKNTMQNGKKNMTFKPRVTELIENRKFEWLGSLFIPGLFDGRHYFELRSISNNNTELIHGEHFSGLLSGIILKQIESSTLLGFEAFNMALKKRCESNETT